MTTQQAFINEALTDFTVQKHRENFAKALETLDQELQRSPYQAFPLIGGKEVHTAEKIDSVDPANPEFILGKIAFATQRDAEEALRLACKAAPLWDATPYTERAACLKRAAQLMRDDKFRLAAIMVREAGKNWAEADADVAEAIDFCDFYAHEMLRLGPPRKTSELAGEDNHYFYQARGVCVVISPWNFPLAIACGMVVAALVAGNACILKPAEQTCIIANELGKILLKAGIPGDAFALLPGWGEDIGRFLVQSPKVDMICFTGSKPVGLEIIRSAGTTDPHQHNIKKVVAELGGKNAIIVDEDADMDDAVKGVVQSAFGFAGQKCSACSRVIVVGKNYETFLQRLKDASSDVIVGEPKQSSTFLGPVIDEDSQARIKNTIAEAKKSEKLLFEGQTPSKGFFVPATVFRDVSTSSKVWKEEIFGPVVACLNVNSFDEALALANDSQYALTGGVFSRSPANLERARREFKVGNLYLNRKITGALVCRQPFGGFKMSGVGSKAGGVDYLLQFMEPRTVTENTLRRGFAPETGVKAA